MTAPPPSVTVAILNYEGHDLLGVVIPSVLAQSLRGVRVVVVDDGSEDDSVAICRERWPEVEVVEIPRNRGVAVALNEAVRAASGSDYVALLNNDLELDEHWLEILVHALERHREAASATGKTFNYFRRDELDGTGDILMGSGAATRRGLGERDYGQYERPEAIFSPCAGMAVYRRRVFDEVGVFDESFFAYQEDIDWGFRAQLAGFTAWYEPTAIAWHMCGATTNKQWGRFNHLQRRNQVLVVLKCYPAALLARHLAEIISYQAGWLAHAMVNRELRRQLRALIAVLPLLPRTLTARRQIQASRRVSRTYLESILTASPHAGESLYARARRIRHELHRDASDS